MSGPLSALERGCDWNVAPPPLSAQRCDRPDLVVSGDGPHICTVHAEAWMDEQRARRAEQSAGYVTRSTPPGSAHCEMPSDCHGCGQKRAFFGQLCDGCIAQQRQDGDDQRHRDRYRATSDSRG